MLTSSATSLFAQSAIDSPTCDEQLIQMRSILLSTHDSETGHTRVDAIDGSFVSAMPLRMCVCHSPLTSQAVRVHLQHRVRV